MKKHLLPALFLSSFIFVWVQVAAQNAEDIDLTDVVIVEDVEPEPGDTPAADEPAVVVEIPDEEIKGASIDVDAPVIPEATEELPGETEVVLEIPGQEVQAPGEASMAGEETISIDFPDEDVRTILRNVADLFDLNLVIPDTLQGRTSVKLRNITWRQVFEVVLEPLGFTYVEDRNIIRIKSIEELTTEPVDTRVFIVNFADADAIKNSLSPLIDSAAGGNVEVNVRSNALVITERPSRMNKIQEIIERLDKPNQQVMIESKFIEVTNSDSKNVGVNWAFLKGYEASAGGPDGFQREWSRERSQSTTTDSGVVDDSGFSSDGGLSFEDSASFAEDIAKTASTSRLDTAVFSAAEFNVVLSALEENNDSELMSNPTVVTMNNEDATIKIVTVEENPVSEFNEETGTSRTVGKEQTEYGTTINVRPQVNAAGFINLEIQPSVSNKIGEVQFDGQRLLTIAKRSTDTNVMIKDGYTLALGGLVQNEKILDGTKVPVLGDLPGVGRLFKSKSDRIQQRNLIVFITAKTLNPDGSTYRDIIDPRKLDEMGIGPADVPGYKLPEEQKELLKKLEDYRADKERSEAIEEAQSRIKRIQYAQEQAEKERASEKRK